TNLSGTKDAASQEVKKDVSSLTYIALPNWVNDALLESPSSNAQDTYKADAPESSGNPNPTASTSNPSADQIKTLTVETPIPTVSSPVLTACFEDSLEPTTTTRIISKRVTSQDETPSLDTISTLANRFEDILRVTTNSVDSDGVEADVSNIETTITASPTPTLRIYKDHPKSQIIGPMDTPIQTKNKSKEMEEQSFISIIHQKTNPALLQFCLFSCFLSQVEPKKISDALQDPSWVLKNTKKDKRGIVIRNKARLVAQGHTHEEGINYDEVFAPVTRIKAIILFLAYASFMRFTVYQMDVKSAFFYGTIDEEVYVIQPPGFQDLEFPARVYKVEKAIEFEALMHEKFQISAMGELNFFLGLQVLQKEDGIFLSQDKYVGDILKKFRYSDVRLANTLMDKENPWGKDRTGKDVDLHLYRSMIGSLMYLTASRPDIMFAVCTCATHQVTPKECHLYAVKRIFRYLKGHPKLGLLYPKESPFDLVAYSDSDYGSATQDRKSTTGGCQFLGRRLISWQCKKQTIVATSTTKAEDCFEKKLISMDHIHTDENVADLLTKPFDAGRFQYLVNADSHPIVDFVEASHIRYALTFNPTVYVSHIRQFWSTARIETMEEGAKILATVDGKLRTVFESSIRRNLKLHDKAGINSLPDAELFENLTLMGYNISSNQKFTFQKGQFSHQWKYLIHTIMLCLSPKSTGFNEFSSNITTALLCLATNRVYNFSKMIFDCMGKGSGTPTKPHHIPSPEAQQTSPTTHYSPLLPPVPTEPLPTVIPSDTPQLRHYTRRARIAQSSALPPIADEPASPIGDDSQGEACPTISGLEGNQDRENITKTFTLPYESTSRVISLSADEGSMQYQIQELTALCTSLQRQHTELVSKFTPQELEINMLKARIKLLEDKDRGVTEQSRDDAPIKGKRLDKGEEAAERVSDDTEEMETVLISMDATSILTSGGVQVVPTAAEVSTASVSIPAGSGVVSTASPTIPTAALIFTTATESTPYTRRKDSAKEAPLKEATKRVLYISAQESCRLESKTLQGMTLEEIKEKFDPVWKQFQDFIPIGSKEEAERFKRKEVRLEQDSSKKLKTSKEVLEEKLKETMELIPVEEVYVEALQVKHPIIDWKVHTEGQRSYWKIIRLGVMGVVKETLSIRPATSDKEKELWVELKRLFEPDVEDYLWTHTQNLMHAPVEWKLYDTLKTSHCQKKFPLLVKKVPPAEEKRCRCCEVSTATEVKEFLEEVKSPDEVPEEKVKEMMQLVPIEEVYVEALQIKHPIIDWKVHTEGQRSYWKITRLGGSSASYQFFVDILKHLDREDINQLWALVKESLSNRPPISDKEIEL
nr:putative ribonuclease H-like domain-containing protein [Tanacetum cinerariifolium]